MHRISVWLSHGLPSTHPKYTVATGHSYGVCELRLLAQPPEANTYVVDLSSLMLECLEVRVTAPSVSLVDSTFFIWTR